VLLFAVVVSFKFVCDWSHGLPSWTVTWTWHNGDNIQQLLWLSRTDRLLYVLTVTIQGGHNDVYVRHNGDRPGRTKLNNLSDCGEATKVTVQDGQSISILTPGWSEGTCRASSCTRVTFQDGHFAVSGGSNWLVVINEHMDVTLAIELELCAK
jgi:hypothetical protein